MAKKKKNNLLTLALVGAGAYGITKVAGSSERSANFNGVSVPGPKGDKGDQGDQGVRGPKGETGLTGPNSLKVLVNTTGSAETHDVDHNARDILFTTDGDTLKFCQIPENSGAVVRGVGGIGGTPNFNITKEAGVSVKYKYNNVWTEFNVAKTLPTSSQFLLVGVRTSGNTEWKIIGTVADFNNL